MKFFSVFWVTFTSLESELTRDTDPEKILEFHKKILEAIQSRDPSQAHTQLLQHFKHVKERINHYIATTGG
jgi:DNA-binding FadR family transcriptional regulator